MKSGNFEEEENSADKLMHQFSGKSGRAPKLIKKNNIFLRVLRT